MKKKSTAPDIAMPTPDGLGEAPARGNKNMLIPAVVVAVGLIGGGFMMSRGGGDTPAGVPVTAAPGEAEPEVGELVELGPLTLNLADGTYAKVALAVQLAADPHAEEGDDSGGGHGGGGAEETLPPDPKRAKALDATIGFFGSHTAQQLTPAHFETIKAELAARIGEAYEVEVIDIYFTDFIIS